MKTKITCVIVFLIFLSAQSVYAQIIPKTNWSLKSVDSQELVGEDGAATNAFDNNNATIWHTKWYGGNAPLPHEIQINLGQSYNINGFRYLPRQDGDVNGRIGQYEFYVSADGTNWGTAVATGTFANSASEKEVLFTSKTGQYIRLRALTEVNGNPWSSMAEINVLGSLPSGNQPPNGVIDSPASNMTINAGDRVTFAGTGSDPDNNLPLSYLWNFGTGSGIGNSALEDPGSVQFNTAGTFTVTFTVSDSLGLADSTPATKVITVLGAMVFPGTDWQVATPESLGVSSTKLNVALDYLNRGILADAGGIGEFAIIRNGYLIYNGGDIDNEHGIWSVTKSFTSSVLGHLIDNGRCTLQSKAMDYVSLLGTSYPTVTLRHFATMTSGYDAQGPGPYGSDDGWSLTPLVPAVPLFTPGTAYQYRDDAERMFGYTLTRIADTDLESYFRENIALKIGMKDSSWTWTKCCHGQPTDPLEGWCLPEGFCPGSCPSCTGCCVDFSNPDNADVRCASGGIKITSREMARLGYLFLNRGTWNGVQVISSSWVDEATRPQVPVSLPAYDGSTDPGLGRYGYAWWTNGIGKDGTRLWPNAPSGTYAAMGANHNSMWIIPEWSMVIVRLGIDNPHYTDGYDPAYDAFLQLVGEAVMTTAQAPNGVIDSPASNMTINVGGQVTFTGTGSDPDNNLPLSYLWNFGTGSGVPNSTFEDPGSVQFNTAGTFTVTFTVTDSLGLADATPATRVITVVTPGNQAPNGVIDSPASNMTINVGGLVTFTGSGSDPDNNLPLSYLWNFGAGSGIANSALEDPGSVQFNTAGTFTVTFTVTDSLGLADATPATRVITVVTPGNQAPNGVIDSPASNMTINVGGQVTFTGTVSDPDNNLPLSYLWNFGTGSGIANSTLEDPGSVQFNTAGTFTVTFTVADSLGLSDATPATRVITVVSSGGGLIPKTNWSLKSVDSQELVGENGAATNAFDNNNATIWHTKWFGGNDPLPHEIQINLGGSYSINGFRYLPRQDGDVNGRIGQYEFYVSADGTNWGTAVATGTFASSALEKEVLFTSKPGQYIRLRALTEINGNPWASMAEINVLGSLPSGNQAPNGVIDSPATNMTINVGGQVTFMGTGSDPDNNLPLGYLWNFGTGSGVPNSTLEDPGSVQFNTAGTFTVTFTVTDSLGLADATPATRVITVVTPGNQAPNGVIDSPASNMTINVGGQVTFTGTGSDPDNNLPLSYLWNFGIGSGIGNSTLEDPGSVQFNTAGTFTVTFTVTDSLGLADATPATRVITVVTQGNQAPNGVIDSPATNMTINVGGQVTFTGTGSDPDNNLPLSYLWNFGTGSGIPNSTFEDPGLVQFNNPGTFTVTFTVTDFLGLADTTPATRVITVVPSGGGVIPKTGWSLKSVDSQELVGENGAATNAFDNNNATIWHTKWYGGNAPLPHEIQINLGQSYNINGFRYLPRQDGAVNGRIGQYEFYVSADGTTWGTAVATGTFANSASEKEVLFTSKTGQYIRLRALTEINGNPWASMAEINVLGGLPSGNQAPNGVIDSPATNMTINVGGQVTFTGTGSDPDNNLPLSYLWNFGTGSGVPNSTLEDPGSVQFNTAGTFTVTFTVTDFLGLADSTPATKVITVLNGQAGLLIPDFTSVPYDPYNNPFQLVDPPGIINPVISISSVTDVQAEFVADPFLFSENGIWYLFFEVFDDYERYGKIALAKSPDGLHWTYDRIVLDDGNHHSYPFVLKYNGRYYMIPESYLYNDVTVYEASNFPYNWNPVATLVSGRPFVDPQIFRYNNTWWLFVSDSSNAVSYLYYSDNLLSGWTEHPKSPVIRNDAGKSRGGGRTFVFDNGEIIRIAQKDDVSYGEAVRAFQVDVLTTTDYAEHELPESPILGPTGFGWNSRGMHQFDPWWTGSRWLCSVDGLDSNGIFSIGIYISGGVIP